MNNTNTILVNGQSSTISPMDRGFQYGDGLFETMAAFDGHSPWFDQHYVRLCKGCDRLTIPSPHKSILYKEIEQLIRGRGRCVVKVIYSRGVGGRGYRSTGRFDTTRVVMALAWPEYNKDNWQQGIRLYACKTPLSCNPVLAGVKHLNRLEQVLASQEWDSEQFAEGLMQDPAGNMIEGVMSNLFFSRQGQLYTPDLSQCGVEGLMRAWVLEQCEKMNIPVQIAAFNHRELETADEVFMTNSLIGLWPVVEYKHKKLSIGPIYNKLIHKLNKDYPVMNA